MTREEAIKHLYTYSSTNGSGQTTDEQHEEAKRMAIDALKKLEQGNAVCETCDPGWIPCSERLPEGKCDVLLLFNWNMAVGCIYGGEWRINSGDNWCTPILESEEKPVAWMPLPEPYKGGEDE